MIRLLNPEMHVLKKTFFICAPKCKEVSVAFKIVHKLYFCLSFNAKVSWAAPFKVMGHRKILQGRLEVS